MKGFSHTMRKIGQRGIEILRRWLHVLGHALRTFADADAGDAAAGMAYYAFFSLFPLMLLLVAVGSLAFDSAQVQGMALDLLRKGIPIPHGVIEKNIRRVFQLRGTMGILGGVGLLWSASGFFTALAYHIGRAWTGSEGQSYLKGRLVALGMVSLLAGLLVLALVAATVLPIVRGLSASLWGGLSAIGGPLWSLLSEVIPLVWTFLMLLGLYRWVPRALVRWPEAIAGALVATGAMEITTRGFSWYLRSGLARYELIYGSLGAVGALLLWIYLNSLILLFGAHLSAAVAFCAGRARRN